MRMMMMMMVMMMIITIIKLDELAKPAWQGTCQDGSVRCVRSWIEEEETDPYIGSDTYGWTMADWANDAVKTGRAEAQAVKNYLDTDWPDIRRLA